MRVTAAFDRSLRRCSLNARVTFSRLCGAIHVDEVDDDHAADGPDAELLGDLAGRLEVGLGDRVFQALLADEAPGVDVDRGQRLHLVDDQVAARLQPDLALERAVDLDLDAEAVEDRIVAVVELDVPGEVGHERGDELLHAVVLAARVDDQLLDVGGEQIAHRAQQQVEVVVDQRRDSGRPPRAGRPRSRA